MTKNEVIKRLREELKMPHFNTFIEEKNYSEEDYQQLKSDLEQYYQDYVQNVSSDFEGGLNM